MASVALFPRLQPTTVARLLDEMGDSPVPVSCRQALRRIEEISYAASGGNRNEHVIDHVDKGIRTRAKEYGFPGVANDEARSKFDYDISLMLGIMRDFQSGEALRNDVWAFIATVILPDVVAWRFKGISAERFHGGVRNAFQRLWVRGRYFDRGGGSDDRWLYLRELTEDAMVQIFERASLSSEPHLAQAIAHGWVRTAQSIGRGRMEPVMRTATKLIRLRNEIVNLAALPADALVEQIDRVFKRAVELHSGT